VRLSGNQEVLFSDTVGFIQKLPTQLVAAFRATLEEIAAASVVVHVLDISAPNAAAQCSAVLQVDWAGTVVGREGGRKGGREG
jgi:GTP-binding protein HflX